MPKIPAEGEYFTIHYITDHAFEPKSSEAISNLIGHFNNILFEAKRDVIIAELDLNDPLFEIIKKLRLQIDPVKVYARALEKELLQFSSIFVDIRDLIK